MRSIGVRELRQQASRYLRAVAAGETIQVTDRGRAVALLVPVPKASRYDHLVAVGRLEAGDGDILELGEPLEAAVDAPMPSEVLAEARARER